MVSALMLLGGALLPLCFLVSLLGRVESARLVATQAAWSSVRAAVLAPSARDAQVAAQAGLSEAQQETSARLSLQLGGSFARGGLLEADVTTAVALGTVPFLGRLGTITLEASARAPIDLYRSFPAAD